LTSGQSPVALGMWNQIGAEGVDLPPSISPWPKLPSFSCASCADLCFHGSKTMDLCCSSYRTLWCRDIPTFCGDSRDLVWVSTWAHWSALIALTVLPYVVAPFVSLSRVAQVAYPVDWKFDVDTRTLSTHVKATFRAHFGVLRLYWCFTTMVATLTIRQMAPLAFDTLVTIPLIIRAVQIRRQGGGHSPLIQTFLREGVFYFILVRPSLVVDNPDPLQGY
jgi:hypothetical protein